MRDANIVDRKTKRQAGKLTDNMREKGSKLLGTQKGGRELTDLFMCLLNL